MAIADTQRSKWLALALLAAAQFVVVLDASIVNVALPSIGSDLNFSQDNLSWVVNAYTLFFGGFLLLGGRLADRLGRRRMFIAGMILFALASLARRPGAERAVADHRALRAGPRRRAGLPRRAVDRHDDVHRGRRAQQGARRLGRGRRLGRRRGRAARRRADQVRGLGVGAVRQRADRPRRRVPRAAPAAREPRPPHQELRRRRRGHGDRPGSRCSSTRWSTPTRPAGARPGRSAWARSRSRCSAAFVVIERRSARAARAVLDLPPEDAARVEHRRAADRHVAVLDVLLHLAVPAADPRLRRAEGRPRVPAARGERSSSAPGSRRRWSRASGSSRR